MGRQAPPRALAMAVAACLLAGLGFIVGPVLSTAARGPVPTIAREVHASLAPGAAREIDLPISASHVVLHWAGNRNASITVAFRATDGTYGAPEPVALDDADVPDDGPGAVPSSETFGQVLVADGATAVRVASDRPIGNLTIVAIDTRGSALQAVADAALLATGVGTADAAVTEPTIISRAAWGANEGYRFDSGGYEKWPRSFNPLQKIIVHHTDTLNNDPNPAATIRAIYYDQAIIRGWGDIGYNWLVDAQGRVYQGRYSRVYASGEAITGESLAGNPVRGGHAKDFNDGTVGIALLGTFVTVLPPAAQRTGLVNLAAWVAERHGLNPLGSSTYVNPVTGLSKYLPNIAGHRDVNVTDCPGDAFYATFPTLRQQVANAIAATTGSSVDHTAPTGVLTPMLSPTGGSTMTFGLPFSEPITGLAAGDFTVSGTSSGWSVTGISGTASTYTVTVHAAAPTDGTVVMTLAANSVTDLAGNTGPPTPLSATATFATDTTKPSVVLWRTPHRGALSAITFDVTVTFSEPVVGLSASKVLIGGTSNAVTPWTIEQMLGSGATYGFTISATNPVNGTVTITVPAGATTDPAGNPNTAASLSVIIDRTAPTTSTPLTTIRTGLAYNGSPMAARVTWAGYDSGGSGVASYDVERSINGGAYSVIATGLTSPGLSVGLAAGYTYRFAVRAHDRAGNVGAWRAGATTSTLVRQDNSGYISYGAGWHLVYSTAYSGGAVHYASTAGAWARYTFVGRAVGFVTTLATTRGQVRVYLDGVYLRTLDLYRSGAAYRQVAWAWTSSGASTHTLTLVVVGMSGRPRVDLDAFLVLR